MGNKFLRRHSNVSFLFIISQVIKKESNLLVSNVSNLVFSNGRTCKVSSKIFGNAFCAVNIAIANVKEKPFVFLVKLRSIISSGFLNLLAGIASIFNNFKDMVFPLSSNSINKVKLFKNIIQNFCSLLSEKIRFI